MQSEEVIVLMNRIANGSWCLNPETRSQRFEKEKKNFGLGYYRHFLSQAKGFHVFR